METPSDAATTTGTTTTGMRGSGEPRACCPPSPPPPTSQAPWRSVCQPWSNHHAAVMPSCTLLPSPQLKTYMEKEVAELTQELEGVRASVAAVLAAVDKTEAEVGVPGALLLPLLLLLLPPP